MRGLKLLLAGLYLFTSTTFAQSKIVDVDAIRGVQVEKNVLIGGDAELPKPKFNAYADAAGTSPVDGTGGTTNVTIARSATTPLSGNYSWLFTVDAANRQGQGFSYDFNIDKTMKGKSIKYCFDYAVSANYADDDVQMWVYYIDGASSRLIQPTPFKLKKHTLDSEQMCGEFQTEGSTSSLLTYRLIGHVASTNTLGYTVKMDNFQVGKAPKSYGASIVDLPDFTPTGSASTNTTYTGKARKVGGNLEANIRVSFTGAPTIASYLTINLPYTIDTAKLTSPNQYYGALHGATAKGQIAGGVKTLEVAYNSSTSIGVFYNNETSSVMSGVTATTPGTIANGDFIDIYFSVPIVGWSSSQLLSSDAMTRVYSAKAYRGASAQTVAADTDTEIVYDMETKDDHDSYSIANGRFTAKVSGTFRFEVTAQTIAGATAPSSVALRIKKNGAGAVIGQDFNDVILANKTFTYKATGTIDLIAGDYISAWMYSSSQAVSVNGTGGTNENSMISITQVQGPAQIAASETVAARYTGSDGASLTTTSTLVKRLNKDYDTTGLYNPNTGAITYPIAGKYRVHITTGIGAAKTSVGVNDYIQVSLNTSSTAGVGAVYSSEGVYAQAAGAYGSFFDIFDYTITVIAGTIHYIQVASNYGATSRFENTGAGIILEITKIGN